MKVRIIDKAALSAIQPAAMRAYLEASGWVGGWTWGQTSEVFVHRGTGRKLLVPVRADLGDYASVMSDILGALSEVEDRSELLVYKDIICQGDGMRRLSAVRLAAREAIERGENPLVAVETRFPGSSGESQIRQTVRSLVREWLEGADEDED